MDSALIQTASWDLFDVVFLLVPLVFMGKFAHTWFTERRPGADASEPALADNEKRAWIGTFGGFEAYESTIKHNNDHSTSSVVLVLGVDLNAGMRVERTRELFGHVGSEWVAKLSDKAADALGVRDIQVGDDLFDQVMDVRGRDPERVLRLLNSRVRDLIYDLSASDEGRLRVTDLHVRWEHTTVHTSVPDAMRCEQLVPLARALVDAYAQDQAPDTPE